MGSFSFNIQDLDQKLHTGQPKLKEISKVPFAHNNKKFAKVAFDMFRSNCDDSLWELVSENGESFLIKRTDLADQHTLESQDESRKMTKGGWSICAELAKPVTVLLFGVPIRQFTQSAFGYTEESKSLFAESVLETVVADSSVAKSLVKAAAADARERLLATCSENLASDEYRSVYIWLKG